MLGALKLLCEYVRTWSACSCRCHKAREEQEALFPFPFTSRSDEENAGTLRLGEQVDQASLGLSPIFQELPRRKDDCVGTLTTDRITPSARDTR